LGLGRIAQLTIYVYTQKAYTGVLGDQKFDWNDANRDHLAEHNITPQEAEEVLLGFCAEDEQEPVEGEPRTLALGVTVQGRFLAIAYTERDKKIRPITGWDMTKKELRKYVEELNHY
jgi:uncharacterized DUF497 family protein